MVLHATQPTVPASASAALPLGDKENVGVGVGVAKPNSPAAPAAAAKQQHSNGRRPRSRPTANSPSPVLLAREAARDPRARRRAQSQSPQPVVTVTVSSRGGLLLDHATGAIGDADIEMSDYTTTPAAAAAAVAGLEGSIPAAASSQRRVQLPRFLRRPTFRPINPEAIAAVEPELKGVALEYILEGLKAAGPQLFRAATNTRANPPRNHLPRELQVIVNDISATENMLPTHLVAVYTKPAARVTIHPVHSLVLAAHCAHLPPLPPTTATTTAAASAATTTLPVVPICLPSPATFPILLQYLYTKRVDHLLASLLPTPPARDDGTTTASTQNSSAEQLAQTLAATFTHPVLLAHAAKVHGVWSDAAALGVFEDRLWRTIETAWKVLLDALAVSPASGDASWKREKEKAGAPRDDAKMQMVR